MEPRAKVPNSGHPAALGSFRSWIVLLWNSSGIDRAYFGRAVSVCVSTFLTAPLRIYERGRYGRRIRNTSIHPSPIFIIGHWRTGTTHLHNLLCQDKALGYVSTFQALAPGFSLVGKNTLAPILDKRARQRLPTRVIDNIPFSFAAPQEEEYAIANTSPYSFIHQYSFPRQAAELFRRYTLFEGLSETAKGKWAEVYLTILRKATLAAAGKRLVLKSPNNTARIRTLLEIFPDAKFVHTYRNPYDVFRSTMVVYERILPMAQLQEVRVEELENYIVEFYGKLMRRFLAEKALIPAGNLVEVRFEDLEREPMRELRRVYEGLSLPGFAEAEPAVREYLSSVEGYEKNRYEIDDRVVTLVNRHWQFAFDEWGYERREPSRTRGMTSRPNNSSPPEPRKLQK